MGPHGDLQVALPDMLLGVSIAVGEALPLCGLPSECPMDTVSVGVYSGTENAKPPYICVSGHMCEFFVFVCAHAGVCVCVCVCVCVVVCVCV